MKVWLSVAAVVCAMAVGPSARALDQDKPAPIKPGTAAMDAKSGAPSPDGVFIKTAAMAGMAEVDHGELAATNAASNDVKEFAQKMVADHSKANDELKTIASQKNIPLPTELDAKHKAMQDKLAKLKGAAFDRAYMTHMAAAHKEAAALFEREAKSGKDPDVKAFAEKTLPTIQDHLKRAQDLNAKSGKTE
jgi:putative membrane protein